MVQAYILQFMASLKIHHFRLQDQKVEPIAIGFRRQLIKVISRKRPRL